MSKGSDYKIDMDVSWRVKHLMLTQGRTSSDILHDAAVFHLASFDPASVPFPIYKGRQAVMRFMIKSGVIKTIDYAALRCRGYWIETAKLANFVKWRRLGFDWMMSWCLDVYTIAQGYGDTEVSHTFIHDLHADMIKSGALIRKGKIYHK
jgi:hypothetical protein